ncbi:MAG TPA: hypothetical protein VIF57_23645 [Polyangia bacterium]
MLALCASVVLGVAISADGCGGVNQTDPVNGGSKGPEMKTAMTRGPGAASASQMAQSVPQTRAQMPPPVTLGHCAQGMNCVGTVGCIGGCDPSTATITMCAACDNTAFTDCRQQACNP